MDKLVERAIEHTNKLIAKGVLVWHEIPEFDTEQEQKDWWITPNGDRETLYSIASLFASDAPQGFSEMEARDILEDNLCEKFPQYCD
jgi:hypothetical protein